MKIFHIEIDNRQDALDVDRCLIQEGIRAVLEGEGVAAAEVNVAIVDDAEIHIVNREFLSHDYPTDVISFLLSEDDGPLEGELIVSAEHAMKCAHEYGWTAREELLLYAIHGTLHLVGYDDLDETTEPLMRQKETFYLAKAGADVSRRQHPASQGGGSAT